MHEYSFWFKCGVSWWFEAWSFDSAWVQFMFKLKSVSDPELVLSHMIGVDRDGEALQIVG